VNAQLETVSKSVGMTESIGRAIASCCRPGDVVALIGELGAGKTQFVRGLAGGLGIDPRSVSSPTYVMIQEYDSPEPDKPVLVHIDAYRLRGEQDLGTIGWQDDGEELRRGGITAIEWADRIADALPEDRLEVRITHTDLGRLLAFEPKGEWANRSDRVAELLDNAAKAKSIPCPICSKQTAGDLPTFPFCSDRCRKIDLGRWLDERYLVSRPIEQIDLEEGE